MELQGGRQHAPLGLCYLLIGVVGCLGHLRLISIFRRHACYHGNNRNTYLLHLSLSVANLGVIGGFPFPGLSYMAGNWLFGTIGCRLYACEGMVFGIASILMLTLLAAERYLVLYKPDLMKAVRRQHYLVAIGGGWAMALYWALLPLWGFGRYILEPSGASCAVNWHTPDAYYHSYIVLVSVWCYVIPYVIMVVSLIMASCVDEGLTVDDFRSDVLLTSTDLIVIPRRLALLSLLTWTPYTCVCLQFVFRDPALTSHLTASLAPLCAKLLTTLVPFLYGASSDGLCEAATNNKPKKQ